MNNSVFMAFGSHFEGANTATGTNPFQTDNSGVIEMHGGTLRHRVNGSNFQYTFTTFGGAGYIKLVGVSIYLSIGTTSICSNPENFFCDSISTVVKQYALTMGATIATPAHVGSYFTGTLTSNATLSNPANLSQGQTVKWRLVQGSTAYTLAYGSMFKWPGGTVPTFPTGSGAVALITGVYDAISNTIMASMQSGFA